MWQGQVEAIHIAPEAAGPAAAVPSVRAVAGRGLEGDRYFRRAGTYSRHPGNGREVTLIEAEVIEALARDTGIVLEPGASRRNLVTRSVPLNDLVGVRFRVGEVVLEGTRDGPEGSQALQVRDFRTGEIRWALPSPRVTTTED